MTDPSSGDGAAQPASLSTPPGDRVGIAIVGLGGAVATTAVAGVALMRAGVAGTDGLPLAALEPERTAALVPYESLVFGGWDLYDGDLAAAARHHNVLDLAQYDAAKDALAQITPWPAYGNDRFCLGVTGEHCHAAGLGLRAVVDELRQNLRDFQSENGLDRAVVITWRPRSPRRT